MRLAENSACLLLLVSAMQPANSFLAASSMRQSTKLELLPLLPLPPTQNKAAHFLEHKVPKSPSFRSGTIRSAVSPPLASTAVTAVTSLFSSFTIQRAVALASLSATAKLLSSIALGAAAAKKPGVLDPAAISALSRLTYWIFQPAFLLCSVSQTLYNASVGGGLPGSFLALMPITALLQITLGAATGILLTRVIPLEEEEARNVRMCTAFANSGPLPLIFAYALFGTSAPAVFAQVASCVSFYLLVWSPLFWSFGKVILGTYNDNDTISDSNCKPQKLQRIVSEFKKILSPPVIGSILGMVVGGIPSIRSLFFGNQAWLAPLFGAMHTFGTAYLPAALLVLAGSLIGPKDEKIPSYTASFSSASTTSSTTNTPSVAAILSIAVSRFILAPILSFALMSVMSSMGWLGPAGSRARAIVTFVVLCEGCMPPAQNSVIMLQLANLRERSKNLAQLLTLLYGMAVVPVTILLSACLSVSGILAFQ